MLGKYLAKRLPKAVARPITQAGAGGQSLDSAIRALFANGEQGIWRDPSDFSTMYQNYTGTPPVTAVEQPVGVVLDKRLGLVPNVVQAPLDAMNFSPAGSTPPTAANTTFLSEACGSVTFPANAGGYTVSRVASATYHPIVAGRRYTHSYRIALSRALTGGETLVVYTTGTNGTDTTIVLNSGTAGGAWIDFADATVIASASASGVNSCYVYAESAIASPITIYIRQYTVKEIPGNHASQTNAASRPVLQQDGNGSYYLAFDGVDDYLRTTFPNLGSNVTIGRSIPGTGASILTGQTIGAGNWDDSTSHCALVIIDRALTGPETALLTEYLNTRAGL